MLRSPAQIPVRPAAEQEDAAPGTLIGRIPLSDPSPAAPGGFAPKAFEGEVVPFRVVAFREGHDLIGAHVRLRAPSGDESLHRLSPQNDGTDGWRTPIALDAAGAWSFRFEGFSDDFATWAHAAEVKAEAGVDLEVMSIAGAQLLARAAGEQDRPAAERRAIKAAAKRLSDADAGILASVATDAALAAFFAARPLTTLVTATGWQSLLVERTAAGAGAWYEFFPRSEGAKRRKDGSIASGTFRTATRRLP
ncbi:MAG: DUF3416 domain-containing protein, partial [Microbacterium sp.]|nr:DUF3416 domain-containing protein [Microbacterium sp.]